jgi:hypothetical protein
MQLQMVHYWTSREKGLEQIEHKASLVLTKSVCCTLYFSRSPILIILRGHPCQH